MTKSGNIQNLQTRAVRGSMVSIANQLIKLAANLVMMFVAALYLSPDELGLFGIAFSIQVLTTILRDGGLTSSLVRTEELREDQINSVFWFNVAVSAGLAGMIAVLAKPTATFFEKPLLAPVLWVLAVPIVFQSWGSVQEALLRKSLRFGAILVADSVSATTASAAAIVALILGAGVWALVLRVVIASVLLTVLCWHYSAWRPRLQLRIAGLRSLWSFGSYFLLSSLLAFGVTRLDNLIIGKLIGLAAAGSFFFARNLALNTIAEITNGAARVMFPVFSAIQSNLAVLKSGYISGTRSLVTLILPLTVAMASIAPEAVNVILPEKWHDTTLLLQIISLQGLLLCVSAPAIQLLYARGRSRAQFMFSVVSCITSIGAFVFGAHWGIAGVAICWTIARFLLSPIVIYLVMRETDLRTADILTCIGKPIAVGIATAIGIRVFVLAWTRSGLSVGGWLVAAEVTAWAVLSAGLTLVVMPDTVRKICHDVAATGTLQQIKGVFGFGKRS